MRYFFRSRIPEPRSVLLIESGSRWILEKAYASMRTIFPQARFDLMEELGTYYRRTLEVDDPHLSGENLVRGLLAILYTDRS